MPSETPSLFASVIQEHLELKRRNAALEHEMPLERYMTDDPFENHPLFKTEEQARVEDTMDGVQTIVDEPTSLDWPTDRGRVPGSRAGGARRDRGGRRRREPPTRTSGRARATSTGATSPLRRKRRIPLARDRRARYPKAGRVCGRGAAVPCPCHR